MFVKVTNVPEGGTAVLELHNGNNGPITLDTDLNAVVRITDKVNQKLKITVTTTGAKITKTYSLAGLTLAT